MDNSTKILITGIGSFILGTGIGGAAAFFVSKSYFKKKCDDEIQNLTAYYVDKYDNKEDIYDDEGKEESDDEKPAEVQTRKEDISNLYRSSAPEEMAKTSYSSMFNSADDDRDIPKSKKKSRKTDPKLVDSQIWDANPENFEKKFLVYYDADSVTIDEETEKQIENGEALIGIDNLDQADKYDDVIFVSNSKAKTIYQVTVERAAYSEVGFND